MFKLEETEIGKAIDRCKEIKPTMRVIQFGTYTVTSSRNDGKYIVRCYRDTEGFKVVDCNCKAGQNDKPCFHGMAAVSLHMYLAEVQMILKRRTTHLARARR
jgi:hypothetical protein